MTTPTGILFSDPQAKPLSTTGVPQAAAYYLFYLTGTTTPANVYADGLLTTPLSQTPGTAQPSCTADSAGRFNPIYLNPSTTYRVQLYSSGGSKLEDTDPYVVPGLPTQALIGAALYPQTAAEIALSITPTTYAYPEGDIRRYGATTGASDNSTAITNALKVSGGGGSAAFIPGAAGGAWATTNPIVVAPGSSMYGVGKASIIAPANNVDGLQFNVGDSGIVNEPRFFRDFAITGTLSGSPYTNNAHGIYINAQVNQTLFSNLAITNFCWGAYVSGLYYSTFLNCFIQNCWQGIYFYQQSINVNIYGCVIQYTSGSSTLITAGTSGLTYSQGISVQSTPEVEGLHIQGGSLYGFNYNIFLNYTYECQIEAVDISYATVCPVFFGSIQGPFVLRDCWIELAASAAGTWNNKLALGDGNLTGVFITAITPTNYAKISIENNFIYLDNTTVLAGSTGLYIGNFVNGIVVAGNQLLNFDVGIGGGNTLTNTGGTYNGATIKWNTLNCVLNTTTTGIYSTNSAALLMGSGCKDCEVGPNYVVPGTGAAATASIGTSITVPNQSTGGNQQFPVGTPVQCSTTAAGFTASVTYWVASSSGTTVTLAATSGGSAITGTAATSIGTLTQTPLPVIYSAGTTPPGASLFARGAFIGTLSDPAVSGVVSWTASGKTVTLTLPSGLTGSAGSTTMTMSGLPSFLAPTLSQFVLLGAENNSAWGTGMMGIGMNATINIYPTPAGGAWTNSGTKALVAGNAITYGYGD